MPEGLLRPVDVASRVLPVVTLGPEDAQLLATGRRPRTDAEGIVAAVHDGELVVRRTGYVSVTFDHRVVDGARAAEFGLAVIRRLESA